MAFGVRGNGRSIKLLFSMLSVSVHLLLYLACRHRAASGPGPFGRRLWVLGVRYKAGHALQLMVTSRHLVGRGSAAFRRSVASRLASS